MKKQISCRCWKANQSWYYVSVSNKDGHKLRVRICRNAYDHQSHAIVEHWDGARWQEVCSKPITACVCREISYVHEDVTIKDFVQDEKDLLAEALAIVT